jgi:glycosyltransferase involved in cell wall biosynthesis
MKSDIVILLSGKFREELNYITGDRGNYSNILSIPNPVSFIPEVVNLRNKKKELLYVGRIDTLYKRVDLLLEIWNKVYARFPDWELKIVGGGGEMEDVIKMAESLRLQRVSFEGFQNPISYYRDASIFCMTSSSESFGMVLLEAMQYSVVPIAFNSYVSVTDIIDDGENGILIKPFNCESYIKELISLMSEKSRCDIIAEKAQEKSMQFSIEKVGSVWVSVFENLMLSK